MPEQITISLELDSNGLLKDPGLDSIAAGGQITWTKPAGVSYFVPFGVNANNNIFINLPTTLQTVIRANVATGTEGREWKYKILYYTNSGKHILDPKISVKPKPTKQYFTAQSTAVIAVLSIVIIVLLIWNITLKNKLKSS